MSRADGPILVLGIGNVLLRDEGIGVRVVEALDARAPTGLPPGTRVVDGGTLGLDLLPMLEDAAAVVLVDAVNLRRPAGTVAILRGSSLHGALAQHVSPHQVGVGDLLAAARLAGTLPEHVALVAIQPEAIEIGLDPTPAVAAAIPEAVDAVVREVGSLARAMGSAPVPAGV